MSTAARGSAQRGGPTGVQPDETTQLFVGLMSGTSLDGVDGVLADLGTARPQVKAHTHRAFDASLRAELLALNVSAHDEIHRSALAANRVAREYAQVVKALLALAQVDPHRVVAVGAHGQTVRHRPGEFDGTGYTVQLLNAALLAELSGIDVVADFRSRDVAAGGQGAPLVPAFHAAMFASPHAGVAVLNLGGMANVTLIPAGGQQVVGFDCGPGMALLDGWCQRHLGQPFDDHGAWAAGGHVLAALLRDLRDEPFFERTPPKSTGRDLFSLAWLDRAVQALGPPAPDAVDVQATLAQLTAQAAADAIRQSPHPVPRLLVCGGGALNDDLMRRLALALPGCAVVSTETAGVPVDQVEALAFAWLAQSWVQRRPGNLSAVTGASAPRVLGALYPSR